MTTLIIQTATPKRLPRIQIFTVEDLLNGKGINLPKFMPSQTFKQAERSENSKESRRVGNIILLFQL
jgi:hypothetical protein